VSARIVVLTEARFSLDLPVRSFINFIDDWAAAQLRFLHLKGCGARDFDHVTESDISGCVTRSRAATRCAMKLRKLRSLRGHQIYVKRSLGQTQGLPLRERSWSLNLGRHG
jgi:hypothetical protein